jgi:CheY-like chemotaxis protein
MKASILIADHDAGLAEAVRRCLISRGYEVEAAITGLECHDLLHRFAPALLVIDPEINWGGGDGILDWLITEEALIPPMVVLAHGPNCRCLPDRLEPWIDVRIHRPQSLNDLLPYVSQLESLAWWSQSPDREAVDALRMTVPIV